MPGLGLQDVDINIERTIRTVEDSTQSTRWQQISISVIFQHRTGPGSPDLYPPSTNCSPTLDNQPLTLIQKVLFKYPPHRSGVSSPYCSVIDKVSSRLCSRYLDLLRLMVSCGVTGD